ncbi:MAG: sugar phosphate isomerase/epimerase family protein [Planctomycetota bacterium]
MRLGADIRLTNPDPTTWERELRRLALRSVVWPLDRDESEDQIRDYTAIAAAHDVLIAEVPAWCNPLHPDAHTRAAKIERCQTRLALAERIGARCCVNVGGSCGESWWGPHPRDLDEDRFDLVVETVRCIVDAVRPTRTRYTLETMPWMHPDSPQAYRRLIAAVDRPGFAVHLDPVNMITSPQRCFANAAFLRECFELLGPWIRSCHAKDVRLDTRLTVHLDEVPPGQGALCYRSFLAGLARLDPDTPLIIEHVEPAQMPAALAHIRTLAAEVDG